MQHVFIGNKLIQEDVRNNFRNVKFIKSNIVRLPSSVFFFTREKRPPLGAPAPEL